MDDDDNDKTVITLNKTGRTITSVHQHTTKSTQQSLIVATARSIFGTPMQQCLNAININISHAIADTGATNVFIMEGAPVNNKQKTSKPLTINLPDGTQVKSTHEWDINIPGLPQTLIGHIVPKLSIASLIGIRVLCAAGCKVTFCKKYCNVSYKGRVILKWTKRSLDRPMDAAHKW